MAMGFLQEKAECVPIPTIIGCGRSDVGPYIMTEHVEGPLLANCLSNPKPQPAGLRADVSEVQLRQAYRSMAKILLDLYQLQFPLIGNLDSNSGKWKIKGCPMTMEMNELIYGANVPYNEFNGTGTDFISATHYLLELARQQHLQLKYQRNNAIDDEDTTKRNTLLAVSSPRSQERRSQPSRAHFGSTATT